MGARVDLDHINKSLGTFEFINQGQEKLRVHLGYSVNSQGELFFGSLRVFLEIY